MSERRTTIKKEYDMSIKIFIAEDHKIMRDGLRSLFEEQTEMEVVGEAEDGRTTVEMVQKLNPDVVIMDIGMPDLNGIEATRLITSECPDVKVIVLSMYSKGRLVSEALKAGASGYLLKKGAFEELIHAIDIVISEQTYLSPEVANVIVKNYVLRQLSDDLPDELSAFSILTPREREVLQLLTEGETTQGMASRLYVSASAIEKHRRNIMRKLNIDNIAGLTKYAIREGVTSLES